MASASSLLSEEQFLCSICLDVFTDPVTTPCGHNYCKACITRHWGSNYACKCPLCQKQFYARPELSVNKVLSEMADRFRKSKQLKRTHGATRRPAEPGEVSCNVCTEVKCKALKSCLVCLTSYCETHLERHQRVPGLKQHVLIDPVKNLDDFICKKHDRPLEMFCTTDHTCVCQTCTGSDHASHQIVSLKEGYEGKMAELGKTECDVQQMIRERQAKIQEVKHTAKKDGDKEKADSVQVFAALLSCVQRCQAEVADAIEEKQKTTEKQAEGFIKELEQEIAELKKRSSELKQLSRIEDHLQLLHNFPSINTPAPTKDWAMVTVHRSPPGSVIRILNSLEKTLTKEIEKLRNDELGRILINMIRNTASSSVR